MKDARDPQDAVEPVIEESGHVIRDCRRLAQKSVDAILEQGLFGCSATAPLGTLRGIDVLPMPVIRQKMSRAALFHHNARGTLPSFVAPKTFFEKLILSKFFAPIPMPSPADKLGLAPYCTSKNPNFAGVFDVVWSGRAPITPELISELNLSDGTYYAKSNCGSGTNIPFSLPCTDETLDRIDLQSQGWLDLNHGTKAGEWWYGLIGAQNFIERDMSDGDVSLTDWKFHCGHGRVLAVQVDRNRSTNHEQLIFDRDFNYRADELFFKSGTPGDTPPYYDDMRSIAEDIAKPFEYARVDLYFAKDRIYLGEITLAPMGGMRLPRSAELDAYMGQQWQGTFFAA